MHLQEYACCIYYYVVVCVLHTCCDYAEIQRDIETTVHVVFRIYKGKYMQRRNCYIHALLTKRRKGPVNMLQ